MLEPSFFFFFLFGPWDGDSHIQGGYLHLNHPNPETPRHVKSLSPTLYVGHVRLTVIFGVT